MFGRQGLLDVWPQQVKVRDCARCEEIERYGGSRKATRLSCLQAQEAELPRNEVHECQRDAHGLVDPDEESTRQN